MASISDSEFLRYQRQIALPEIGDSGQSKLKKARLLVIGCGGLGCSAIQHLACSGVGNLVVADGDTVEISNLPRQILYTENEVGLPKVEATKKAIARLNASTKVRTINKRLEGSQLELECMMADLVLDCSDNFETRQAVNLACMKSKTPLISGAAIGWDGQLSTFLYQDSQPCYHCLYPINESQPDMRCSDAGVVGPVVGIIGTHQALTAIRIITTGKAAESRLTLFDGLSMQFHQLKVTKDPACPVCNTNSDTQEEQ
ncbi:putative Dinucleotide-utilizing enzyme involved in molybdopterin and thiamine biosynthesis family 2 [Vibrio nigripulchritudo MADA3029]|uniref:HesA/MoeB/ThiF family protein n=1 Tax=Vibrio nigripulchritudo TaxID=28173 RepID=UPI0003B20829|nr:molybdopterin-synthase adenylyltransferase MoeB [Vibrio nigripulchritudo]CCN50000.1 putative Dinucleotide-utilizing enzyme involved in molybdopterin and thiamine biosynthesis family 2 [Vibrio nigripulchritudo MADA3020]CCN53152.1 putative Dinucleotide-utilizing enzyme involved in molybdopterin and thiamine biosynthesis family 2 [Vibrio nigripulchritudo MADA3021]CCN58558.1 putative Dinucleotide-utilizing enzyme involved in molybdopterin and thiamine biosynthesis family 2 [Vibrio nigripulchritud